MSKRKTGRPKVSPPTAKRYSNAADRLAGTANAAHANTIFRSDITNPINREGV